MITINKYQHFEESFPCEVCGFKAKQKSALDKHVRNIHSVSGKVTCPDCNKIVKQWCMTQHRREYHSKELPQEYSCDICTYTTNHKSYLIAHKKNLHKKGKHPTIKS